MSKVSTQQKQTLKTDNMEYKLKQMISYKNGYLAITEEGYLLKGKIVLIDGEEKMEWTSVSSFLSA